MSEVHQSEGGSKDWRGRFMEFFMLFLAVFLGFLSEYKLEHVLEKEQETEYVKSLQEDIRADIAMLEETIRFADRLYRGQDSLKALLLTPEKGIEAVAECYRLNFAYNRWVMVEFNDQTISEMRNSGNLVLIEKDSVLDAVLFYYKRMHSILDATDKMTDWTMDLQEFSNRIFNRSFVQIDKPEHLNEFTRVSVDQSARFMDDKPAILVEYGNHLARIVELADNYVLDKLARQVQLARALDAQITKAYNLD